MVQTTPLFLLILTVGWCRAIDVIPKKNDHDIYAIYANANSSSYHKTDVETSAYTIDHRVREYGQFRYETRMADGVVYGCFGYNDAFGKLRSTHFVADHGGTRILRPFYPSKVYHSEGVPTNVEWEDIALPKQCQAHEILVNVKPINFKTTADATKFQNTPILSKVEALKNTVRNKPASVANQATPKAVPSLTKLQPKPPTANGKQQQQRLSGTSKKPELNEDDNSIAVSNKAGTVQKPNSQAPKAVATSSKIETNQRGGQKFSTQGALAQTGKTGLDNVGVKATASKTGEVSVKKVTETSKTGTKTTLTASSSIGSQPTNGVSVPRGNANTPASVSPNVNTAGSRGPLGVNSGVAGFSSPILPEKESLKTSGQIGGSLSNGRAGVGVFTSSKASENGSPKTSGKSGGGLLSVKTAGDLLDTPLGGNGDPFGKKSSGNDSPKTSELPSTPSRGTGSFSSKTVENIGSPKTRDQSGTKLPNKVTENIVSTFVKTSVQDNGSLKTGQSGATFTNKVTENKVSTFVKTSVPENSVSKGSPVLTSSGFLSSKNLDSFLPNGQKSTPSGFSVSQKSSGNVKTSPQTSGSINSVTPEIGQTGTPKTRNQPSLGSGPITSSKTPQKVSISLGKSGPSFSGVIDGSRLILKSGKPKSAGQNRIPKITEGKPTQIEIVEDDADAVPTLAPITGFTTPKFPTFGNQGFSFPAGFSNPPTGSNNNFPALPQGFTLPAGFPSFGGQAPNKTVLGNRVNTPDSAGNKPSALVNFPAFPTFPSFPTLPNFNGVKLPTLPNLSGGSRTGNAIKPVATVNSLAPIEPIYSRQKIQEFKKTQQGLSPELVTAKPDSMNNGQQVQQKTQKSTSFTNSGPTKNPIPASSLVGLPLNTKNILPTNIGGPINLPPGFSNASPSLQPLSNNVFGKTPSVTNILVGVPQESVKPILPKAAVGNSFGPEASGSNVVGQRPSTGKSPGVFNPAPAVKPLANRVQASAFVSSTNKNGSSAKVQVSLPATTGTNTAAVDSVVNRGSFGTPQKNEGPKAQKMTGFNMVPLPDAPRPADVPADCPCLLMTSDKKQQKQSEAPVTQAPMPQVAFQQLLGQLPFAHGLPVLGFIPVLFVPYCNAGASNPINLQSFGLPTALPVPYPCSACA